MPRAGRIQFLTLGCRLNEAEIEEWADACWRHGWELVAADAPADIIVFNTCAVTAAAVRKSRQLVRRQHRLHPLAQLVVSGCWATLEPAAVAQEPGVTQIVVNQEKDQFVAKVLTGAGAIASTDFALTTGNQSLVLRQRQRAFIKVQDGCRYQCSFCITTQARGAERSRSVTEVIAAIRRWEEAGIQEVVLTGVHLGGYRSACGADLTALVAQILAATTVPRVRLGSLEPWGVTDAFWALFANPRLMPHLHVPLQSGSDAVLRRMARRCKTADFAQLVARGRTLVPELNVTTDVIVGFPGETASDWQQTLTVAEAMAFGQMHIFSYSPRAGTVAATLPDAVAETVKQQRSAELQVLARRLTRQMLEAQCGKQVMVLCEGDEGEAALRFGYTPNYLPVQIIGAGVVGAQRLRSVRLTGLTADGENLIGRCLC